MPEEKEILKKAIGSEGNLKIAAIDNKTIRIELEYDGDQADAGLFIKLDLFDALKAVALKTDTKLDDKALAIIESLMD